VSSIPKEPLVSVVIPTHNHAHYLGEAIASALSQLDVRPEIIVVDDGSTDNPAAVVDAYPSVRFLRQPNSGLAAARNTGWQHATGTFVVFLDADDRLLPNALRTNLQTFSTCPDCGFVYAGYAFIDDAGRLLRRAHIAEITADPYATFLRGNVIGMHATVMYRRDVLEESGGFDPSLRACEDYDLYLRISRTHPVAFSTETVAEYRLHGTNMSRNLPFMLHWALAVLDKQWPTMANKPEYRAAYRAGRRGWCRYYVGQQIRQLRRNHRLGLTHDLAKMVMRAPRPVLEVAAAKALRRAFPRR
jgi:glycosyltransferase involved in cell wall biosynthesis